MGVAEYRFSMPELGKIDLALAPCLLWRKGLVAGSGEDYLF